MDTATVQVPVLDFTHAADKAKEKKKKGIVYEYKIHENNKYLKINVMKNM